MKKKLERFSMIISGRRMRGLSPSPPPKEERVGVRRPFFNETPLPVRSSRGEGVDPCRKSILRNTLAGTLLLFASTIAAFPQSAAPPTTGSEFHLKFEAGAIVSLTQTRDRNETEFVAPGRRLGDEFIKYRQGHGGWQSNNTVRLAEAAPISSSADGGEYTATYQITNGQSSALVLRINFNIRNQAILWTLNLQNATGQ